jgi:hypothetical protein
MPDYQKGLHENRRTNIAAEGVFAREWERLCKGKHLLGGNKPHHLRYLLDPKHRQDPAGFEPSARDCQVASTVVQWLGSPCGMTWLLDTLAKAQKAAHTAAE